MQENYGANEPRINTKKEIILEEARHPLIDKNKVVPINISLGNNNKTLVITGPNTGGKTVLLKTIGLLSLMVKFGLLLPCDENSNIMDFVMKTVDIMGKQISEKSLDNSDYILDIYTDKCGLLDINKLDSCFEYGYNSVMNKIDEIKNILDL